MRRFMLCVATVAALAGCGGDDDPSGPNPQTHTVTMTENAFSPSPLTISRGSSVRWTNGGQFPHNSTGPNAAWSSGNLNPGQSFTREFTTAGTFDYQCTLHQGMTGRVIVQ